MNSREVRVERCKNKPKKGRNFAERLDSKDPKGKRDGRETNGKNKSGAYRRLEEKQMKLENKPKDAGWIKTMKQRQKPPSKQSSTLVQSFAGDVAASDGKAVKVI